MVISKKRMLLSLIAVIGLLLALNHFMLHTHAKNKDSIIHYTIKKDDTFYLLGLRFNSSVEDILSMNRNEDPKNLLIGSKVKLPIGLGTQLHYVKKGDTLEKIASSSNSTVYLMSVKNNIVNQNQIYPGDILVINPIPELENFPITEFTVQFNEKFRSQAGYVPSNTNMRIENGLLKMDNIYANLVASQYTDKKVDEALRLFGYKIMRGHTMENMECDYRMCFGTKIYTIRVPGTIHFLDGAFISVSLSFESIPYAKLLLSIPGHHRGFLKDFE